MSLRAQDIHVGCILRPRNDIEKKYPGIRCEWNELSDHRDVNPALGCPSYCRQDIAGQKHPIIVLRKNGDSILYVAMTGNPIPHDQVGTQYSPIGHYFPPGSGIPHPARFRSRYWLKNPNPWNERTIDAARQSPRRRLIELEKHSKLRLPHVYVQKANRFKAFGGHNTSASEYRLDEGSYYRLMDRLGLHASNYNSDMSPRTLHRPHSTVSISTSLSSRASASSTQQNQSALNFSLGRLRNGPSQRERYQNTRNENYESPSNNLPNWLATLRNWIRLYSEQCRNMKMWKSCKIQEISNPVAEDLPSPEADLNELPLPYTITLQCTV
ncbi:uncharacterized protein EAE98_003243 [Botrytis deweyae]|uniref:Spermatogenesis-associated protein 48 n=1 Tax=Botrytis deweyae TaxID=2478750 RepID=A0ABQ7IT07_9HELO|nr:uncharacterized protein EAE98_003243 [Botrytis deweyae]KAF7933534.1 hypothetical protein EAE98_003243 [Botrytis deweyae]